jgi:hypothetical protein
MSDFEFRGLEIHSPRMWDTTQARAAMDFMVRYNLNILLFHQNDLIDQLVYPEKYFPPEYMWKRFPPRFSRVHNNRTYINNIIDLCHRRNLLFIPEVKELYFDEWITELHPEVRNAENALLCPTHPFWWEYMEVKMEEFLKYLPDIDGIVVSPGTRESKLSIASNRCGCERCKNTSDAEWYAKLINVMYEKLAPLGKKLIVRDFAFEANDQTGILRGVNQTSGDIIMALKNTPHDYYPTFPTNAAIGKSGHPEWIEFDTWGQFFGNGVFPASVIEDMQMRMRDCKAAGSQGIWLRTDWENMADHCSFNSPDILNTIAGAMLAQDVETPVEDIYREWAKYGMLSPLKPASYDQQPEPLPNPENYIYIRDFMKASWKIIEETMYVRGHLFQDNSMFPYSMERFTNIMMKTHSMDEWKPGASRQILPTDENIKTILAEKQHAIEESEKLKDILRLDKLGYSKELTADLKELLDLYPYYVRCFALTCRACFLTLKAETTRQRADIEAAGNEIGALRDYSAVVKKRIAQGEYTHQVPRLIDYKRLNHLADNIEKHLAVFSHGVL